MNKTYSENITVEEIKELNLSWFEGEIFLVDNMDKFYQVIFIAVHQIHNLSRMESCFG